MDSNEILFQLSELLCEDAHSIQLELEPYCRCLSCWHYTARDCDGEIVASGSSLEELVESYVKEKNHAEGG
jgi:hypothetical protein